MNLQNMTYGDLEQLQADVDYELDRRRVLADAPRRIEEITRQALAAQGVHEGDQWQPSPVGYPQGWTAQHAEAVHRNNEPANTREPGTRNCGWTPISPGGGA